jgi:ABC-type polysaccharide/polyol phosphate transport system ATPase subunit
MTAISVQDVGKCYEGAKKDAPLWALRGVSFEVERGEALALVGENGSGKSTLLDLLMGVTRPTQGRIHVAGASAALVELGAGLFAELSGRENAVQAALLRGRHASQARAHAEVVAEIAELGAFFDRPLRTYSAGMAMRLGFAIAVSASAEVTFVDEVLAVGDGYYQRRCIDRLLEMKRNGTTLVIASHDLHALRGLCSRAVWLRDGRVEQIGGVDEVVSQFEEYLRQRGTDDSLRPGTRSGTGEVVVDAVRLLNEAGQECSTLPSGETLRVAIDFEVLEPVDSPIMGVALFRDDGVYCYGPNTRDDLRLRGVYHGRYTFEAEFPKLALLPGHYEISLAFYDKEHVYAYAWHHRLYKLQIVGDVDLHGVVRLPHTFRVTPRGAS